MLLLIAYAVGPAALLVLATAVVIASGRRVYNVMQRRGFRPATLLGLVATVGVMFAAYWRGPALPLVVVLVFVVTMLWYLLGVVEARPLANVAVTVMAFVWVGVLGSYAALLLRAHHGGGFLLRRAGRPWPPTSWRTSPAAGSATTAGTEPSARARPGRALGAGGSPPSWSAIVPAVLAPGAAAARPLLGLVVAVLAPIGDLFESMVKRDLL